jgi:hypothetical protein
MELLGDRSHEFSSQMTSYPETSHNHALSSLCSVVYRGLSGMFVAGIKTNILADETQEQK